MHKSCRKGHELTPDNISGIKRKRCKICAKQKHKIIYDRYKDKTREQVFNENKQYIKEKFEAHLVKDGDHLFYTGSDVIIRCPQKKLPSQHLQVQTKEFSTQSIAYWLVHGHRPKTFHYSFCEEKHCVNPNHIKESNTWYNAKSFSTTCTKGHDLTDESSYIEYSTPGGKIYKKCKVCKNTARRALNERNRIAAKHSDRVEQTWSQTMEK